MLATTLHTFAVTREPLDAGALMTAVTRGRQGVDPVYGGVAAFIGVVRGDNQGRRVTSLEYEAYEPLAVRAFERIAEEVAADWPSVRLAIHHRIGKLAIGESSVAIAAAAPHRAEAFEACRYSIERLKQIAPIWKREHFEGGEVWIEGATADPDDVAARQEARRRACGSQ